MLLDGMNGADARMIQRGSCTRFANEPLERRGVLVGFGRQKFQGHPPAQLGVFRFVDHTHAAAADFADNLVVRDELAFHPVCGTPNGRRCRAYGQRCLGVFFVGCGRLAVALPVKRRAR
jgi:hypothetical protein